MIYIVRQFIVNECVIINEKSKVSMTSKLEKLHGEAVSGQ